jgi:hypothetical protein
MTAMLYPTDAQIIGTDWRPIPGLLTGGEMVGGLVFTRPRRMGWSYKCKVW